MLPRRPSAALTLQLGLLLAAVAVQQAAANGPNGTFLGCFQDNLEGARDLPNQVDDGNFLSCQQQCSIARYRYFGRQSLQQCFCGNSYGTFGPSGVCSCDSTSNLGIDANCIYSVPGPTTTTSSTRSSSTTTTTMTVGSRMAVISTSASTATQSRTSTSASVEDLVLVGMHILGIDYTSLIADEGLLVRFEAAVKSAVASVAAWTGLQATDVVLALSPGSVAVQAMVSPPASSQETVLSSLAASTDALRQAVQSALAALQGVGAVSTGDIVVDAAWVQALLCANFTCPVGFDKVGIAPRATFGQCCQAAPTTTSRLVPSSATLSPEGSMPGDIAEAQRLATLGGFILKAQSPPIGQRLPAAARGQALRPAAAALGAVAAAAALASAAAVAAAAGRCGRRGAAPEPAAEGELTGLAAAECAG